MANFLTDRPDLLLGKRFLLGLLGLLNEEINCISLSHVSSVISNHSAAQNLHFRDYFLDTLHSPDGRSLDGQTTDSNVNSTIIYWPHVKLPKNA